MYNLRPAKLTGIGHYARELVNSLSGMLPEHQLRLIHQGTDDSWGLKEENDMGAVSPTTPSGTGVTFSLPMHHLG